MSETVNQTPKRGYGRHPHHLFKIPEADLTTRKSMYEEGWQTSTTVAEPLAGNALTAVTRNIVNNCTKIFRRLLRLLPYKMLFFEQSTHIIMALAIVLVTTSLIPGNLREMSNANNRNNEKAKPQTLVYFVYLASFSIHLGSQFWMTIVSGLSLYFNLSRHAFGDVQKILFPKYFSINSVLSAITLVQFRKMNADVWQLHTYLQLIALNLCFLLELTIWLYMVPSVLRLIAVKTAIEKSAGLGKEVGRCNLGRLVKCPHYMTIHRIFRKMHTVMAMGNVITIMCSVYHLTYIAA
ncbi:transmembrane protein 205-like [Acyrthosiphon pisum]|uniref:TMEM205-like domain-containing protein n=1 Tax=Acyrthosiphon pisum TaxID=7029 RepID=A0A8R1W6V2_ACYPI|nr:transmembrane protein 205-like [Acyrthosiphon pisum]|eukprot:XP_003247083.1 PREDICTED: transmembrane protein 205-like [Acyrthosiphon pisum]